MSTMVEFMNWLMKFIGSDTRYERAQHKVAKPGPWAGS